MKNYKKRNHVSRRRASASASDNHVIAAGGKRKERNDDLSESESETDELKEENDQETIDFSTFIHMDDFDFERDCIKNDAIVSVNTAIENNVKNNSGDGLSMNDATSVVQQNGKENEILNTGEEFLDSSANVSTASDSNHSDDDENAWLSLGLSRELACALVSSPNNFVEPTLIQKKSLFHTIIQPIATIHSKENDSILKKKKKNGGYIRDIIAASQTGSGKTLAYGLPILDHILKKKPTKDSSNDGGSIKSITALVLVPTRELALQVQSHLSCVSSNISCWASTDNTSNSTSAWSRKNIVNVVGGLAVEKQMRLVNGVPHILIATPGRLWSILQEDPNVKELLGNLSFLVVDEADRMLEPGHFKQLDEILDIVSPPPSSTSSRLDGQHRATFIYSATMIDDQDLQENLVKPSKKSGGSSTTSFSSAKKEKSLLFRNLLKKITFQDPNPVYINLSNSKSMVASGVEEFKINCTKEEKDLILYYLLLLHSSSKVIVFCNSISAIRRLIPILTFLKLPVFGLHAEMQQQQRLKNLERFKEKESSGVLVCSDIAARGLDVPQVDLVIHYHLPRAADTYIHRSGRTARGKAGKGVAISLVAPQESSLLSKLSYSLRTGKKGDQSGSDSGGSIEDFPGGLDPHVLSQLAPRLLLAKQLDTHTHSHKKAKADKDWFKRAAQEADIDYSEGEGADSDDAAGGRQAKMVALKTRGMMDKLDALLGKPVRPGKLRR